MRGTWRIVGFGQPRMIVVPLQFGRRGSNLACSALVDDPHRDLRGEGLSSDARGRGMQSNALRMLGRADQTPLLREAPALFAVPHLLRGHDEA